MVNHNAMIMCTACARVYISVKGAPPLFLSAIAHYFLDTLSENFNCSSIPSPCGWNADCNDTEEGPVCYCDVGYWIINSTTKECESKLPLKVFTVHCSHDAMMLLSDSVSVGYMGRELYLRVQLY